MANSKSNIYPIQLQGAELCLNRYDAEIKQYRGFNRNNSPFVGGCLSNIYKKDVSIDGENFIDKKGNIYSVDTEGVYLNDQKIINYSEHTRFYKKTKLNVPANTVMAISEDIYITLENGLQFNYPMVNPAQQTSIEYGSGYVAHWGDGHTQVLGMAKTLNRIHYDIVKKGDTVVFVLNRNLNIKPNGSSYVYTNFLNIVIVPDVNSDFCKVYDPSYPVSYASYFFGCMRNGDNAAVYMTDDKILVSLNSNTEGGIWAFDKATGDRLSVYGTYPVRIFYYSQEIYEIRPPADLMCWRMTNDGMLYFISLGGYSSDFTVPGATGSQRFCYSVKIDRVEYVVEDNQYVVKIYAMPWNYQYFKTSSDVVCNGSATSTYVYTKNFLNPYVPFFITNLNKKGEGNSSFNFSVCGCFLNTAAEIETRGSVTYADISRQNCVSFYGDFKILVNNGYISNISVAEYEFNNNNIITPYEGGSLNGVILEDWNTISNLLITEDGTKAVYKKADGFYAIERTATPKFSLKYNQLVVNCNNEYNSINIDTGEILHFGTDWNDSYLTIPYYGGDTTNVILLSGGPRYAEEYYLTSSVNEYDLEHNASILLNPRHVWLSGTIPNIMISSGRDPTNICYNFILNGAVNFYGGSNATDVVFVGSSSLSAEHSSELTGLPFPTDANGNVLYNAPLFSEFISIFSNDVFVRIDNDAYALHKSNNHLIMSFYLGTLVENLEVLFILQGQYYGIINNQIFSIQMSNGVVVDMVAIVSVQGLQFVGNTPYEALFFSKTNRCLYSFTGANVLNQKQLVDKISEVRNYLYNPATQTVFLITDIGVLFYGLFGIYLLEYEDITQVYLLLDGVVLGNDNGDYHYIKYYLEEGDTDYTKENINVETSFYGMNNEVVTINDCLYFRIFSEEHEEGDLKVSATTISLRGRKTEETTFKIKASDWDKITHTIYLRYQPKTQRGLGVAFAIDSPFKIASLSVGSQPDAVLVDKVSKGAITAPSVTSNNDEW